MTGIKIFSGIEAEVVNEILGNKDCYACEYQEGDTIFSKDRFDHALGIINYGRAIVKIHNSNGVTVKCLSQNDCFGAAAVFSNDNKYVSEITADTICRVTFIPESVIRAYIEKYPRIGLNYIEFLTGRIRYLNVLVDAYSSGTVVMKLAKFLSAYQNGSNVPLGFTLTELSEILGIGRASLYRALDELEKEEIIEKAGKKITVINEDKLNAFIINAQ